MDKNRTVSLLEGDFAIVNGIGTLTEGSYLEDFVLRVEGLQKAIYNLQLIRWATNPKSTERAFYIAAKQKDLNKIALNIETLFSMEFKRWLEAGYTQENAKKKALNFARQYKQDSLKQHQKQFPDVLSHSEIMRMLNVEKSKSKKEKVKD